jgi:cephalosporin hydroxylase
MNISKQASIFGNKDESVRHLVEQWQNTSMLELWHTQLIQHHQELYRGIGMAKFPQDLWTYEKLLNAVNPEVIIEIGVNEGGFTHWLHDRLLTAYSSDNQKQLRTVIGLDIDIEKAKRNLFPLLSNPLDGVEIILIQCNLLDPASLAKAKDEIALLVASRSLFMIEDSGHSYETTQASLNAFSDFSRPGEWFVVEDTCVDIEELREGNYWPRGALVATNDFLNDRSDFERTNFNHTYGITCHPYGFLRKKNAL